MSLSKDIEKFAAKINVMLTEKQPKAIRKALNEAAKVLENEVKPLVPTISKSTDYRQKGTVRKNVRHRTKVFADKMSGRTVVRVRRTGERRMAKVSDNTKDRTDPFYWFMLDRGTKKMSGRHFMATAWSKGRDRAIRRAKEVLFEEMAKRR